MKPMRVITAGIGLSLALSLAACDTQTDCCADDPLAVSPISASDNLAQVVAADPSFAVLVEALEAQGLNDRLREEEPLTLFAPTDAAFAALAAGSPQLELHIAQGSLDAETLIVGIEDAGDAGYAIPTLSGESLKATREEGAIVLTAPGGARALIEATDVEASNGLMHIVDGVLGTR